jgi:hypothetical protein
MSNVITTRLKRGAVVALAAATVVTGVVALSSDAEAGWRHRRGAAVAAGIIGGIAAGALIAGATRPAYGYSSGYYAAPAYGYGHGYAPVTDGYVHGGYGYQPTCYWTKQRRWIDEDTMVVRRVRVCQ